LQHFELRTRWQQIDARRSNSIAFERAVNARAGLLVLEGFGLHHQPRIRNAAQKFCPYLNDFVGDLGDLVEAA